MTLLNHTSATHFSNSSHEEIVNNFCLTFAPKNERKLCLQPLKTVISSSFPLCMFLYFSWLNASCKTVPASSGFRRFLWLAEWIRLLKRMDFLVEKEYFINIIESLFPYCWIDWSNNIRVRLKSKFEQLYFLNIDIKCI